MVTLEVTQATMKTNMEVMFILDFSASTQVDRCFIRKNQRKFFKDINILTSEECITQHKPLVCDFKLRKVEDTRRKFVPRKKSWNLDEDNTKSDIRSYINKYIASSQKDASVEGTDMF